MEAYNKLWFPLAQYIQVETDFFSVSLVGWFSDYRGQGLLLSFPLSLFLSVYICVCMLLDEASEKKNPEGEIYYSFI